MTEAASVLCPLRAEHETLAASPRQAARLRLNELALHSWDVRVVFDPAAAFNGTRRPG